MPAIAKLTSKLWIAIACGAAAGVCVLMLLFNQRSRLGDPDETTAVLVASHFIARGDRLRPSDLRQANYPKAYVQPGSLSGFDVLVSSGRPRYRALLPIPEGTQVVAQQLTEIDQQNTLSAWIPENAVAVSFAVNATRGVGGNVQPGDLIDVLHTPRSDELHPASGATTVLFQALPVMAVGKRWWGSETTDKKDPLDAAEGDDVPAVITVALNPLGATRLAQARENETLSVILRAPRNEQRLEGVPQ